MQRIFLFLYNYMSIYLITFDLKTKIALSKAPSIYTYNRPINIVFLVKNIYFNNISKIYVAYEKFLKSPDMFFRALR